MSDQPVNLSSVPAMKEGDNGPAVSDLQTRLQAAGFPPGAIDGDFGPGTEAAVLAFQNSKGLLADGIAGPRTLAALGFAAEQLPVPGPMPQITVSIAAKMFPGAMVSHIGQNLPLVLDALKDKGLTTVPVVLASLATIRAETAGFVPLDEGLSRFNTSPNGHPFDLYDNRTDLGNQGPPDGASFKGRGFVQLTGRANYTKFGPIVGVNDLVTNPEQANDPTIAAAILAAFVAAVEVPLKEALQNDDLAAARKLVNGGSHGLDNFTDAYRKGQSLLTVTS